MRMTPEERHNYLIRELTASGLEAIRFLASHGGQEPADMVLDGRCMRSPTRLGLTEYINGWQLTKDGQWLAGRLDDLTADQEQG